MNTLSLTISSPSGRDVWPDTSLTPSLDLVFSRGARKLRRNTSLIDSWMEQLFPHQKDEIAISTLLARGDPDFSVYPHYLCCELVDYSAGMNDVFVKRLQNLSSAAIDNGRYNNLLTASFDGLLTRNVSEWPSLLLIGLQEDPKIGSTPATEAHNRPMSTVLPTGPQSRHWIAKMNEIQMLFHQSNENTPDDREHVKPNGVWLWGEGPRRELQDSSLLVSAQSPELIALSRATNATMTSVDQILSEGSPQNNALIDIHINEDSNTIVAANELVSKGMALLKSGLYTQLNVQLMQNSIVLDTSCTKYSLHKFWVKTGKTIDWVRDACS